MINYMTASSTYDLNCLQFCYGIIMMISTEEKLVSTRSGKKHFDPSLVNRSMLLITIDSLLVAFFTTIVKSLSTVNERATRDGNQVLLLTVVVESYNFFPTKMYLS